MNLELLLEIGVEELPAGAIGPALEAGARALASVIHGEGLSTFGVASARELEGKIIRWGTPRRLTWHVHGILQETPAREETITGPPAEKAFDATGKPLPAALGFAKKLGVAVEALAREGGLIVFHKKHKPRTASEVLAGKLPELLAGIPFKKSMRWGIEKQAFGRPVHWIVCLLGGDVVPFSFAGVKSDRQTRGHRFHAPEPISLWSAESGSYKQQLFKAKVLVDPAERRERIRDLADKEASKLGGRIRQDDELLDTVTNLVEWPVVVAGGFSQEFLDLPPEVLVTSMRTHQKYFAVEGSDGKLLRHFIGVLNTEVRDLAVAQKGLERVLHARLSDAKFFFDTDLKTPLAEWATRAGEIVFHRKIGTYGEKIERIKSFSPAPGGDDRDFLQAAALSKADLATGMVGEFPELQGVMGKAYALHQSYKTDVANAIFEHYLPRGATDSLPVGQLGARLALADKLDTIVACFGVGLKPTGAGDPFALRRAALGIVRILIDRGWQNFYHVIPEHARICHEQITKNAQPYAESAAEEKEKKPKKKKPPFADPVVVADEVREFIETRLQNFLAEKYAADVVAAVLATPHDFADAERRAQALDEFRKTPDYPRLATAFKRAVNIVAKEQGTFDEAKLRAGPKKELLQEPAEKDLFAAYEAVAGQARQDMQDGRYYAALNTIAENIKEPIDRFFDQVLVNCEDPALRENRLALLYVIRSLFARFADFSKVQV